MRASSEKVEYLLQWPNSALGDWNFALGLRNHRRWRRIGDTSGVVEKFGLRVSS